MTDPQIEALAREYVKEVYSGDTDFIDEAEQVLTWLSQRYCIVEKSKVIAEYKRVIEAVEAMRKWNLTLSEEKLAKADLLISLFPSIAKEMKE